jgi:hypothetical protein
MSKKLNVGILINSHKIYAWQYRIIEEIVDSEFSKIVLFIKTGLNSASSHKNLNSAILNLHKKIDKLIFKVKNEYDTKIDLNSLLNNIPQFEIKPFEFNRKYILKDDDIFKIERYNLDVIISFAKIQLFGIILRIPKFGIWMFDHYDNRAIATSNPGYWESVLGWPETGSVLKILDEKHEKGIAIYRSWGYTYFNSIEQNRNKLFWTSSMFIPRILNGIYCNGIEYLENLKRKFNYESEQAHPEFFKDPSVLIATKNLLRTILFYIKLKFERRLHNEFWYLLVKTGTHFDMCSTSFCDFKKLIPPNDRYWADPFVIINNNRYFIFIEEFIYKLNIAHISVLELDSDGIMLSSEKIIDRQYHMSYPFIFEFNNSYYLIPETSKNKTIELFKCIDFPSKWEFVMNLMENIYASDSTVFYYNKKWWLFTSIDETGYLGGNGDELFLFYSDDLFTKNWESHPANPIVSDTKTARGAGRIFVNDNKIYRPSQDCSGLYGRAFNINEITLLNEYKYEEILITKVTPEWDSKLLGTHTFNFDDNIIVIDAFGTRRHI